MPGENKKKSVIRRKTQEERDREVLERLNQGPRVQNNNVYARESTRNNYDYYSPSTSEAMKRNTARNANSRRRQERVEEERRNMGTMRGAVISNPGDYIDSEVLYRSINNEPLSEELMNMQALNPNGRPDLDAIGEGNYIAPNPLNLSLYDYYNNRDYIDRQAAYQANANERNAWYQPENIRNTLGYINPVYSAANLFVNPANEPLYRRASKFGTSMLPSLLPNIVGSQAAGMTASNLAARSAPTTGQFLRQMAIDTPFMYAGGQATDALTRALTPYDSWAQGVANVTGLPEELAGFTNPGMIYSPNVARGLANKSASSLNNITTFGKDINSVRKAYKSKGVKGALSAFNESDPITLSYLGKFLSSKPISPITRRGLEVGLRTNGGGNPISNIDIGAEVINRDPVRAKAVRNYVLFGKRKGIPGYYNSLAENPEQYYSGFNQVYDVNSSTFNNPNISGANDYIDAILYGKEIDPRYGVTLTGYDTSKTPYFNYINQNYPNVADKVPIYNTGIPEGATGAERPANVQLYPGEGSIMSSTGKPIDIQGHHIYRGDGDAEKIFDIWKFLKKDYRKRRWAGDDYKKAVDWGLDLLNDFETPVITETPWIRRQSVFDKYPKLSTNNSTGDNVFKVKDYKDYYEDYFKNNMKDLNLPFSNGGPLNKYAVGGNMDSPYNEGWPTYYTYDTPQYNGSWWGNPQGAFNYTNGETKHYLGDNAEHPIPLMPLTVTARRTSNPNIKQIDNSNYESTMDRLNQGPSKREAQNATKLYNNWLNDNPLYKGEPGLQGTYPEFGLLLGGSAPVRGAVNVIGNIINNKGFGIYNSDGTNMAWVPLNHKWNNGLSRMKLIDASEIPNSTAPSIGFIRSQYPGEGRKLYDTAIQVAQGKGYPGIVSGESLVSAPKTNSTYTHYPDKVLVSNNGHWTNWNMPGVNNNFNNQPAYSMEQFLDYSRLGIPTSFENAPVYLLNNPSSNVATLRLPKFMEGLLHNKPHLNNAYKASGGSLKTRGLGVKYW